MSKVKFIKAVDLNFTLGNYIILVLCPSFFFSKQGNRSFVHVGGGIAAGGIYTDLTSRSNFKVVSEVFNFQC